MKQVIRGLWAGIVIGMMGGAIKPPVGLIVSALAIGWYCVFLIPVLRKHDD